MRSEEQSKLQNPSQWLNHTDFDHSNYQAKAPSVIWKKEWNRENCEMS